MNTLVFEGVLAPEDLQDAGRALILRVDDAQTGNADEGEFVRLQSWYEDASHPVLMALCGRSVRITIEVTESVEGMQERETTAEMLAREAIEAEVRACQNEHAQLGH